MTDVITTEPKAGQVEGAPAEGGAAAAALPTLQSAS